MQIKESNNNGEANKITLHISAKFSDLKIKKVKNEPRYKLPVSPMKTFAGCQLKNKNPINDPIKGIKFKELLLRAEKIIIIEPQISPSIPSIKFILLIIKAPKITKKIKNILFIRKR